MELMNRLGQAEQFILSHLGKDLRLATPLGIGKPNQLINLLYGRAKVDPSVRLTIFTALSLDIPDPQSDLEARFVGPFYKRHFGDDYPRLEYVRDLHRHKVPPNIRIHEFYFQAGSMIGNLEAQRDYVSLNYTHVAQGIFDLRINVVLQLVAKNADGKYSLSCNPDLTLDLADLYKKNNTPLLMVGVVHPHLPFLGGDAEIEGNFFDAIVETPEVTHQIFAPPIIPVTATDHAIGLHASRLVCDDGTLQIGIGSLSDSLVNSSLLRQESNELYRQIIVELDQEFTPLQDLRTDTAIFEKGIYGTSEMLMDGFMHLRRAGILKRLIFDHNEKKQRYLHGAFFLGSRSFYNWLGQLQGDDFEGLSMTRVSKVNDLYDEHELALRRQRKNARFFNTCMQMGLLGEAASETLKNGHVVSGVGGQYNFVAMSHELPDSYSVLMLKSTRKSHGHRISNIVWSPSHITIPRHLRDVVITEYGVAALKGQCDETCIKRILMITDSQFQEELLEDAKREKKISPDWQIPERCRHNTAKKVHSFVKKYYSSFPRFPFGSDFSPAEEILQQALLTLKDQPPRVLLRILASGFTVSAKNYKAELERMSLQSPQGFRDYLYQKILLGALNENS